MRIPVITVSMEPGNGGSKVAQEVARRRIIRREAKRGAFVKQSYDAAISNPENDDLTITTGRMSIGAAAEIVIAAVKNL